MCFEDSRQASQTSLREVTSKALRDWGLFTLTQRLSDEGEVDNALNVTSSLSNLEKIRRKPLRRRDNRSISLRRP